MLIIRSEVRCVPVEGWECPFWNLKSLKRAEKRSDGRRMVVEWDTIA